MKVTKILLAVLRAAPDIIDAVKARKKPVSPLADLKRTGLPGGYPPENGGPGAVERNIDHIRPPR